MSPTDESATAASLGAAWIIDAHGCEPARLRDPQGLRALLDRIVEELHLRPIGEPLIHQFGGEAGVTALLLLSESHLAIHTFPEVGAATLDLYCCRPRPEYPWRARLAEHLGASAVSVRAFARGEGA
jgi:S-adenosylmethionine decarboxylase